VNHSDEELNDVYDLTDGECFYCGKRLSFANYGDVGGHGAWEVDHFIPISRGGAHQPHNWVPACIDCNTRKADLMPWDFDPDRFARDDRDVVNYL